MITILENTAPAALKKQFDWQMEKALEFTDDADGLKALYPLLEHIGPTEKKEGKVAFLIIPQNPNLSFAQRLAKVTLDGKTGINYLDESRLTGIGILPQGHYLAVDVEDGRATLNDEPEIRLEKFRRTKRFGGTVQEGIMATVFDPGILIHHPTGLADSRYGNNFVPCLFAGGVGPILGAYWDGSVNPRVGILSCGWRLGLGVDVNSIGLINLAGGGVAFALNRHVEN